MRWWGKPLINWFCKNLGSADGIFLWAPWGFCWSSTICGVVTQHTSQRSFHNEPIFRLLLKVAVKGTQQCEFLNFCGTSRPNNFFLVDEIPAWHTCDRTAEHMTTLIGNTAVLICSLATARMQIAAREIVLWTTPSEPPKAMNQFSSEVTPYHSGSLSHHWGHCKVLRALRRTVMRRRHM